MIVSSLETNYLAQSLYFLARTQERLILAHFQANSGLHSTISPFSFRIIESYGVPSDDCHIQISPTITQIEPNSDTIQSLNTYACSQYCLFYLNQLA